MDDGTNILIDTSPDFKMQAMRESIDKIDAVLYTHQQSFGKPRSCMLKW
jgi:phosphoribosyl 1,2-cyclic phosphate phosphodiesterase